MRRLFMLLLAPLCACATLPSQPAETPARTPVAAAYELLQFDQNTGAGAQQPGAAAFSDILADDVVMFAPPTPRFTQGREAALQNITAAIGAASGRVNRTPIRAGVSADGAHGFTFGYVEAAQTDGSEWIGKYVAYWIRRPEGWRVSLFKLLPRPPGDVDRSIMAPSAPADFGPRHPTDNALFTQSLAAREQQFSDEAHSVGLSQAFARFGRADAVNVGGEAAFVVGAEAIAATQPDGTSPIIWSADEGVLVAESGDLGVTWGYLRRTSPPPGRLAEIPFFTIWRRDSVNDPWFYIAE